MELEPSKMEAAGYEAGCSLQHQLAPERKGKKRLARYVHLVTAHAGTPCKLIRGMVLQAHFYRVRTGVDDDDDVASLYPAIGHLLQGYLAHSLRRLQCQHNGVLLLLCFCTRLLDLASPISCHGSQRFRALGLGSASPVSIKHTRLQQNGQAGHANNRRGEHAAAHEVAADPTGQVLMSPAQKCLTTACMCSASDGGYLPAQAPTADCPREGTGSCATASTTRGRMGSCGEPKGSLLERGAAAPVWPPGRADAAGLKLPGAGGLLLEEPRMWQLPQRSVAAGLQPVEAAGLLLEELRIWHTSSPSSHLHEASSALSKSRAPLQCATPGGIGLRCPSRRAVFYCCNLA